MQIVTVVPVLTTPESRGTVRLQSTNYTDLPLVDPGYLSSPADRQIILWGYKRLRSVMLSSTFDSIRVDEVSPGLNVTSDADLMNAIEQGASTMHHISGTAGMRPLAQGGVVDHELKVHGFQKLRIVDASVLPIIPTVPIQASVYAVAEKVMYFLEY